jgi:hypothetical protein
MQRSKHLCITGTGFDVEERLVIEKWSTALGASYSGQLVRGVSTHLVCKVLLDAHCSPKYLKALEWGIDIISYQW